MSDLEAEDEQKLSPVPAPFPPEPEPTPMMEEAGQQQQEQQQQQQQQQQQRVEADEECVSHGKKKDKKKKNKPGVDPNTRDTHDDLTEVLGLLPVAFLNNNNNNNNSDGSKKKKNGGGGGKKTKKKRSGGAEDDADEDQGAEEEPQASAGRFSSSRIELFTCSQLIDEQEDNWIALTPPPSDNQEDKEEQHQQQQEYEGVSYEDEMQMQQQVAEVVVPPTEPEPEHIVQVPEPVNHQQPFEIEARTSTAIHSMADKMQAENAARRQKARALKAAREGGAVSKEQRPCPDATNASNILLELNNKLREQLQNETLKTAQLQSQVNVLRGPAAEPRTEGIVLF
jgi:hypothetical protein